MEQLLASVIVWRLGATDMSAGEGPFKGLLWAKGQLTAA